MRLAITFLGLDLFAVDITTTEASDYDPASALSGGPLASMPVGFTAYLERPDEADLPERG